MDNIFANRGLRVRIEGPQCLRDEKIYLEMCKVLLPSRNISLMKLSSMPTGAKIQALVDYISDETEMELTHISGEAIARGRVVDIFNLLQFLEEISSHSPHPDGQPRSAPESVEGVDHDEQDLHTVQAINREFQKHADS